MGKLYHSSDWRLSLNLNPTRTAKSAVIQCGFGRNLTLLSKPRLKTAAKNCNSGFFVKHLQIDVTNERETGLNADFGFEVREARVHRGNGNADGVLNELHISFKFMNVGFQNTDIILH